MKTSDICESFGASPNELPDFDESVFEYETLSSKDHDKIVLECLKKISNDTQIIGAPARTAVWDSGWKENLDSFRKTQNVDSITPKFIRPRQPVRFKQSFIMPRDDKFEKHYVELFQKWLFSKYFKECDAVYEFGCGSGFNLMAIGNLFPNKQLVGLDFVQSSVDLINELGCHFDHDLSGVKFDMIHPNDTELLGSLVGVLTFGAIEQLAGQFHDFIKYLIDRKPAICVHVEPTIELYDDTNLVDWLAMQFHKKRGYSEGLLPFLQELDSTGSVELMKFKRLYFGSLFMEGYNYIVWRPI